MPRNSRKDLKSSYLHVMVQGINKEKIFSNDYFKKIYLKYLLDVAKTNNIRILVYAIMDNHAHFIIFYENSENVSKMMNLVNSKFAKLYNKKNGRIGYVYRDRFKSKEILSMRQLYNTISYIHNNPVKAGLCTKLEDYKYSSYKEFVQNKKSLQDIEILFQTKDYKKIFSLIHKVYDYEDVLKEDGERDYNQVIADFISENKYNRIYKIEQITSDNNLLIDLIIQLREKCNLNDTQITKILKIGKNRIYTILNKKYNKK